MPSLAGADQTAGVMPGPAAPESRRFLFTPAMPNQLLRLRNGIIVTPEFLGWLERTLETQHSTHPGKQAVFDCLRIRPGEQAPGESSFWWQIDWLTPGMHEGGLAEPIGEHQIMFTRAARHTLRDRCLDLRDGRPCLR